MQKKLLELLPGFRGKKIIVWGDLILDEYIYTTTSRISREAPVLVTEFESNEYILGGAGNVVMNVKMLGAVPIPVAFIGTGADGKTLRKILGQNSITTDYLVELDEYRTPKKSRILSGGENTKKQQVLRIDTLNKAEISKAAYRKIEETLRDLLKNIDYLIISDYLYKSVIPDVFDGIRQRFPSRNIIIDSRDHLMEFKNATIATPNEPEIKKLFPVKNFFSEQEFYEAGEELRTRLNAGGIVLKRGHKGMMVFEKDKSTEKIDIHGSSQIVDVTGAGDTVISVVSLALAAGADLLSAAQLANIAAGIVVMKEGCYPIGIHELENELN
jgi:rfaE bifunctional protein kinase chain/domain